MKWKVACAHDRNHELASRCSSSGGKRRSGNRGLGSEFIEEILSVFNALQKNPFLNCRQHPTKNIRWRYPKRFPYRVIYEVIEDQRLVIIAAVLHAARHDRVWRDRV
jgi:toxin ParE1/3/4